jgi:hypothetical protein
MDEIQQKITDLQELMLIKWNEKDEMILQLSSEIEKKNQQLSEQEDRFHCESKEEIPNTPPRSRHLFWFF